MHTRRAVLATIGSAALAGCLGEQGQADPPSTDPGASADPPPPLSSRELPLAYSLEDVRDAALNGGVEQDGIPSIDDPSFVDPEEGDHDADDPVFGVVRNGEAKLYPQRVLVHHEIVNDELGNEPVAVTYCPLTGTVQGFLRGETTFGVSGSLFNSNLIMYDRETESWWPQLLATAVAGDHAGNVLREFEVTWTTFGRWTGAHPDTAVLSTDTGYLRNYFDDPYGGYVPRRGYYDNRNVLFELTNEDDRLHPKAVVIGARTSDGALAVRKDHLRTVGLATIELGDTRYAAVHEPELDTAVVYRDGGEHALEHDGTAPVVDGERVAPDALPLERVVSFDAMWFAWAASYPDTGLVNA
jgi:hypothetical protein